MILSNGTDTEGEEKFYRSLFGGEDKVIELMEKCGYGNDELDCLDFLWIQHYIIHHVPPIFSLMMIN